jgi:hypothetical protein
MTFKSSVVYPRLANCSNAGSLAAFFPTGIALEGLLKEFGDDFVDFKGSIVDEEAKKSSSPSTARSHSLSSRLAFSNKFRISSSDEQRTLRCRVLSGFKDGSENPFDALRNKISTNMIERNIF